MNLVHHELRLQGPVGFRRGLPPALSGELLDRFQATAVGAVRMAFEGRSQGRRRARRSWLERAADVRLADLELGDEAVLHFEAPAFGDVAEGIYDQVELWPSRPSPSWSAVDAVAAVIDDVAAAATDSDRFDRALLQRILGFRHVLLDEISAVKIEAKHRPERRKAGFTTVDQPIIEHAREMTAETPRPREVRVVGLLDMLRRSTQAFALRLDDGEEIRGVLAEDDVSSITPLLGKRVITQGQAIFRPSGRLLRIDARAVLPGDGETGFWSKVPQPTSSPRARRSHRVAQTPRTGVNAFFGRWPGEESDEALLAMLHDRR